MFGTPIRTKQHTASQPAISMATLLLSYNNNLMDICLCFVPFLLLTRLTFYMGCWKRWLTVLMHWFVFNQSTDIYVWINQHTVHATQDFSRAGRVPTMMFSISCSADTIKSGVLRTMLLELRKGSSGLKTLLFLLHRNCSLIKVVIVTF